MKRILSIDDNGQDFEKLGKRLREQGFSISEIVVDETALKDASWHTEHRYLDLFETAPVGIFRSTLEGKFISVNPAVARMLKYDSPEEMIRLVNQAGIAEAVYVDSAHRREVLENVLSHNGWRIFEERFRCKDGSIITGNFHLRANFGAGDSVELNGFIEDITERKLAEESLMMSQLIIDKASLGILRGSSDARILSVNEFWAKVLGYTAEELCSMSIFDIDLNLTEESWREHRKKLTATGSDTFESVHRRKDGTIFPVEITVNYLTFGEQVFSCSFAQDITERKKAEEALRQTNLVVESSPAVLFRWRAAKGWPVEMVSGNVTQFGYTPEEFLSGAVPYFSLVYHEDLERVAAEVQEYTSRGETRFLQEFRIVTKDGDVRWIDDRTVVERAADGRVTHYQGIILDITDRKQAEDALKVSERKYRTIFEHAPFGISRSTRDGKLLSANPALAGILKYGSPEELLETVNRSSIQETIFDDSSLRGALIGRIFEGDTWHVFENRYRCKDGSVVTCMVHSRRILDREGSESEFESFLENITDRLEAEKSLRESEEKFRVLAETAPTAIVVYQGENFVYVNPSTVRLFGYSETELLGMKFWTWVHPEYREKIRNLGMARQRGEQVPSQYEHMFVNKSGEEGWVIVAAGSITYRGEPAGIATFIDITENKRAEERMQAALAEKVVLLKEVHHRVKNNLQIVSSLLELQSDSIEGDASRRYIRESQNRIRSIALVHEQLYKSVDLSVIDFASYVDELVWSLYRSSVVDLDKIRADVEVRDIELGIDEAIPCGLIINELVSNCLKHAFPGDLRGSVSIRGTLDEEGYVCLSVVDTGIGLPQGFDVSTSESLGLQIVSLLTKQLHGTFEIRGDSGMTVGIRFKSKEGT